MQDWIQGLKSGLWVGLLGLGRKVCDPDVGLSLDEDLGPGNLSPS